MQDNHSRSLKNVLRGLRYRVRRGFPGFAHGFLVVSDAAKVQYKTTDYYAPEHERTILWSDAELAIPWPLAAAETFE